MDKNAIKKYAIWAREELIRRVSTKAEQYGITKENIMDAQADSVHGRLLSGTEKQQRASLIAKIKDAGYEQVMEETAYTWFNRFVALRFMEVNNYLPSHVRVFTDEDNRFNPQILAEAIHLDLDGLDMDRVIELKQKNDDETLYKYLLITQCNALNAVLPVMFQKIDDYTELLFPDNILREGSVLDRLIQDIALEDWADQVQIIGWLYQYYNTVPKDTVFANLKKNIKITKENIPAATQLFTPDWIVRYMVENSLGRLWVEGYPDDGLKSSWKYYLEEAEQEPEVQAQLAEIRKEYAQLTPKDIKVIDPCSGSGHICVYMFDVLMQIYDKEGYTPRQAVRSIIENNLYGLDIDERAAQLTYFAVMMKGCQYDSRLLTRTDADGRADVPQPRVYAVCESNGISSQAVDYFVNGDPALKAAMDSILMEMHDAKEYGSLLKITPVDFDALYNRFDEVFDGISMYREQVFKELLPLMRVAEALAQKYHAVVTNPPYMAVSNASGKMQEYVKKNFPDSKSDLFAVFIERCGQYAGKNSYQAMITQHAWMFLSSFEKLRAKLQMVDTINMAHLGPRAFEEIGGEVVQTTSFVMRKSHIKDYTGTYCRLIEPTTQQGKEDMFLAGENRYTAQQDNFSKIPGSPVAYWVGVHTFELFSGEKIGNYFRARVGLLTTDNDSFLRFFWEVNVKSICFSAHSDEESLQSKKRWFPHNKGGQYRKWAGNRDYIVDWENRGQRIKESAIRKYPYLKGNPNFVVHDDGYYFHENVSWSEIASNSLAFRYFPDGFTFNVKGMSAFCNSNISLYWLIGFANSVVANYFARIINPSLSFGVNSFNSIPYIPTSDVVDKLSRENIRISTIDWDSFESSWDFTCHPLVQGVSTIAEAYIAWDAECSARFNQLKANEEELNRIFIDIYGLQDELTPEVEDKDVTVRRADLGRDIRSLISYAVGCMFGRYSPYKEGLIYAGGDWDYNQYEDMAWLAEGKPDTLEFHKQSHVFPDQDNIIPICDDEYFADDIVGRFVEFIDIIYGHGTLKENLKFVADALGGKGSPLEVIRNYFRNDFYADHCKIYQKRPIYWLFDSGKKGGFKALIYMHRYQPDTLARMRTDYVHEQQARYRTAIDDLERRITGVSTAERVKLNKQLTKLKDQDTELRGYEEKIHHLADQMIAIDLDDGVKVNYAKFQDVLAKIK